MRCGRQGSAKCLSCVNLGGDPRVILRPLKNSIGTLLACFALLPLQPGSLLPQIGVCRIRCNLLTNQVPNLCTSQNSTSFKRVSGFLVQAAPVRGCVNVPALRLREPLLPHLLWQHEDLPLGSGPAQQHLQKPCTQHQHPQFVSAFRYAVQMVQHRREEASKRACQQSLQELASLHVTVDSQGFEVRLGEICSGTDDHRDPPDPDCPPPPEQPPLRPFALILNLETTRNLDNFEPFPPEPLQSRGFLLDLFPSTKTPPNPTFCISPHLPKALEPRVPHPMAS